MSAPLVNVRGELDPVLIAADDAWMVLPSAMRKHATEDRAHSIAVLPPHIRRHARLHERARWIPLCPETRRQLADARLDAGLTPHELDTLLAQRNGFVWDVEHGYYVSIDPDVFGLWVDCCQASGEAVAS